MLLLCYCPPGPGGGGVGASGAGILQHIDPWDTIVECVHWTEPKATCRLHRNLAKCVK
jgi:hypothetical protein